MPAFVATGIALFFACLFGLAALHKLTALNAYAALVSNYVPAAVRALLPAKVTTVALALLELTIAAALLWPPTQLWGLLASALLLLVYAGLMAWQLARGRSDLKCGCSGMAFDSRISPSLIYRNLVCVVLAVAAALPATATGTAPAAVAVTAMLTLFIACLYYCSEQLISNAQHFAGEHR